MAFVGVPYHIATFSVFDFQAQVVARAFSGKLILPSEEEQRAEYNERVAKKSLGRNFHSLKEENGEINYVKDLVDWANKDAAALGVEGTMLGHTPEWHEADIVRKEQMKWLFATRNGSTDPPPASAAGLIDAFTSRSE